MSSLNIQTLIILNQARNPLTVEVIKSYTPAAKNKQHLRIILNALRTRGNKIKRMHPEGGRKYSPQKYIITKNGTNYLNKWKEIIVKQEEQKYPKERIEQAIMRGSIDITKHRKIYKLRRATNS